MEKFPYCRSGNKNNAIRSWDSFDGTLLVATMEIANITQNTIHGRRQLPYLKAIIKYIYFKPTEVTVSLAETILNLG